MTCGWIQSVHLFRCAPFISSMHSSADSLPLLRVSLLLFAAAFVAFGWFNALPWIHYDVIKIEGVRIRLRGWEKVRKADNRQRTPRILGISE